MINSFFRIVLFTLAVGITFFQACSNDNPFLEPDAELLFSLDTLTFDTVFTDVGSATRSFKVYNPYNQPLVISKIELEGNAGNTFRLNIDGSPALSVSDVEIPANDSIYIFAEATVDPNSDLSPFIISDAIVFETNGNQQKIILEAWGQNANYIGSKGSGARLSCNFSSFSFSDSKPYVIYGVLVIDSCELILPPDTRLYVHGGLVTSQQNIYNDGIIFVTNTGKITSQGTKDAPVIIRGDRLEPSFDNEPGQWAGILLGQGSTGNTFEHTTIRNSIVGIRVDSAADLTLKNSIIHNTNSSNLLGVHATIYAENCLFFSSNAQNNVQLEYGGDYIFNYCTMATLAEASRISHSSPVLRLTNVRCFDQFCQDFDEYRLNATFTNCIIHGSRKDEIQLFDRTESGNFNVTFDHCMIKSDPAEAANSYIFENCNECIVNSDPFFLDIKNFNYQLDTLSPAETRAIPINDPNGTPITTDLINNLRDPNNPDIGAFEYQD